MTPRAAPSFALPMRRLAVVSVVLSILMLLDFRSAADAAPKGAVATASADTDTDGDGVSDGLDNCALTANPLQVDTDVDGAGNACDADDDGDSVLDVADACPL